jgi:hypothetical protein
LWPTLIIVNKKGMFEKFIKTDSSGKVYYTYEYVPSDNDEKYGYCLSKILFNLYNLSKEQYYRNPDYSHYFSKDY